MAARADRRSWGAAALIAAATLGAAVGVVSGRAAPAAPTHRAPASLLDTGLYDASGAVDPRHLPFAPQYPLWTDGAAKSRWIHLPEGTTIDVSDLDVWKFPAGTKLWKEFAWNGRKVETRMIWKPTADTWVFATYVWNEDQSDALLAPESGVPGAHAIAPGKRHSIPAVADCNACHASAPAVVLGFTALQLSDDRDPLAPHAEPLPAGAATLRTLLAAHRLHPARPELAASPPRIREREPVARAAVGYLSANCGGCHNASGPLARLGFDLLHDPSADRLAPEPAHRTAVGAPTRFALAGVLPESARIVAPGAPARSALLQRMRSRRPSSQMPPLGTVVVDSQAVALVERWIAGLPGTPARGAAGRSAAAER